MNPPFKVRSGWNFPKRITDILEGWINDGGDLSGFWRAMFSGDYEAAACSADTQNRDYFVSIICFLVQEAPFGCYGTPKKVGKWNGLNYGGSR